MTTEADMTQILGIDMKVFLIVVILLGLILFFSLNNRRKNRIVGKKKGLKIFIFGILILASTFFLIELISGVSARVFPREYQKSFDKDAWHDLKGLRYEMRTDLVKSEILIDKNKSELTDLLGEPDRTGTANSWIYDLGVSKAGFGWQYNELKIHFQNAKVIRTELIERH